MGLKNREEEFSTGKAFVESETVIIEETMAARGECRSIDVTFESADIWTLRRREPRLTALDGWWRTIWWNRIGVHVHGTPLDWSILLHRNSKPTVLALRSTEINVFHGLAEIYGPVNVLLLQIYRVEFIGNSLSRYEWSDCEKQHSILKFRRFRGVLVDL